MLVELSRHPVRGLARLVSAREAGDAREALAPIVKAARRRIKWGRGVTVRRRQFIDNKVSA